MNITVINKNNYSVNANIDCNSRIIKHNDNTENRFPVSVMFSDGLLMRFDTIQDYNSFQAVILEIHSLVKTVQEIPQP